MLQSKSACLKCRPTCSSPKGFEFSGGILYRMTLRVFSDKSVEIAQGPPFRVPVIIQACTIAFQTSLVRTLFANLRRLRHLNEIQNSLLLGKFVRLPNLATSTCC